MRVLVISKACIVGIYQRKLELIAGQNIDLLAVVPPSWRDERGEMKLERAYTRGYTLDVAPIRFNGAFHWHFYQGLAARMRRFRPDIVHIDEEPYNLAAWQAMFHARRIGAKTLFFSWQNIQRDYPPPFRWGERWVCRRANHAIVGTESAADVWRAKGYTGPIAVIPQFGVDPDLFTPASQRPGRPFTIGYVGRLVEEKGVHTLLDAVNQLQGDWRLRILGGGPRREALESLVARHNLRQRVSFDGQIPSTEMPAYYQQLDALTLPSQTRPNWKEQFGRTLIEAMATGVPVVGSNSGAIPDVIGDGGIVVPEANASELANALKRLQSNQDLRRQLGQAGRQRVLEQFTHESVAAATVDVYRALIQENNTAS